MLSGYVSSFGLKSFKQFTSKLSRPSLVGSLALSFVLLGSGFTALRAGPGATFVRGDANGDTAVDIIDAAAIANYLLQIAPIPLDVGCGAGSPGFDQLDVNDNEHITFADQIYNQAFLFGTLALPQPSAPFPACGTDPDNDARGFDVVNTNYAITAEPAIVAGTRVEIPLTYLSPEPLHGFSVGFEYANTMTPDSVVFTLASSLPGPSSPITPMTVSDGNTMLLIVASAFEEIFPTTPGGKQALGVLSFDLAASGDSVAFSLLAEATTLGINHRATMISGFSTATPLADNHPQLTTSPVPPIFVRGDMNGDKKVNISDPTTAANYLLGISPATEPGVSCGSTAGWTLDAIDMNDNEYVTLNDLVMIGDHVFGVGPVPVYPPQPECGTDPSDTRRGFDRVNPDYGLVADEPIVNGTRVEIPLYYNSPEPLMGVELVFEHSNEMIPDAAKPLEMIPGVFTPAVPEPSATNSPGGGTVHYYRSGNDLLPATGGSWEPLGTLGFTLQNPDSPVAFSWVAEKSVGALTHRATLISGASAAAPYSDNHPKLGIGSLGDCFIPGDIDNSLDLVSSDALGILEYLFENAASPVGCNGQVARDAADYNDNEFVTVADAMLLTKNITDAGGTINVTTDDCGLDLNYDTKGFESEDPAFEMTTGDVSVTPPFGPGREVEFPILVSTPTDLRGFQFIIEYDPRVLKPFAVTDGGLVDSDIGGNSRFLRVDDGSDDKIAVIVVALVEPDPAQPALMSATTSRSEIGRLRFHLADEGAFRPLFWIGEYSANGIRYRASMVDSSYRDHHPALRVGLFEFVRGNANGDLSVNIADPKFITNWIFLGGPFPNCMHAADANADGRVNIADPSYIYNAIFFGGPSLPAPYPECGLAREGIGLGCNEPTVHDACFDPGN